MSAQIQGKRIAILATDGFEQSELMEPRKALKQAGAETFIVSIESGEITGWNHKDWGESVEVDRTLDRVKPADFDALILPGGVLNPDQLRMNPKAVNFVREFVASGKPVAAICHGPWMLVETGAVRGKTVTSWPSLKTDITNAGGNWVDQEVAQDGQFITSRKPDDIPAFSKAVIELIRQSGERRAAA